MSSITPEELEDMLDRAAKRGATAALREVGLHDDDARKDIIEMRVNCSSNNIHCRIVVDANREIRNG